MHWISQGSHGLLMEFCLRRSEISKMCGESGTGRKWRSKPRPTGRHEAALERSCLLKGRSTLLFVSPILPFVRPILTKSEQVLVL